MTKTFKCASCSAPLDFTGAVTQKCDHCGSTVIAPHDMFYAENPAPFADVSALTGRALKIAEIQRLIHAGKKIEAIKVFRESFGTGLKEAKDAVEAIERGESVDVSGMRVQASNAPSFRIDPDAVKQAAVKVGGGMALVGSIFTIGIVLFVGVVIYFAYGGSEPVALTSTPGNPAANNQPEAKGAEASPAVEQLRLGGEGNGPGRFKDNRHVAVDGQGRIYSSDYSPFRIQVFDAEGKFLEQWSPEEGRNLYGLAADRGGNLYVANDKGLFKFEGLTGKLLASAGRVYPRGVALSSDGKVIAPAGRSLYILDSSLKVLNEIKDAAERASSSFGFSEVAVDGNGVIYAVDRTGNDICKFSPEGKFLDRFESGANSPNSIAIDPAGRIFLSDTSKVKVLDTGGKKLNEFDTYQAFGMAFNMEGDLFIASRPFVVKYSLEL